MKKLLVVLFALTFVMAISAVTFAVTTSTFDGKVEWTFDSADQFGGSDDGKVSFDLGKDFGEGYSAGLKIKLQPNENAGGNDKDGSVTFDGNGWIQMVKDMYTVKFQTGGLGGNAANELGKGYDMDGQAGLQVTSDKLMDGLALTLVLNDKAYDNPGENADNNYYQYLMKAVYTADPLTLGFGYQAHSVPQTIDDSTTKDMMALWAGYKLSDALNFGFEYASRPNEDGVDADGNTVTGSTGIRLKADYTAGALTVNGKVQIQTGSFYNMDPDDVGTTSAWNFFQYGVNKGADRVDPEDGTGIAGTCIKVDAKYQLTDAIAVTGTLEDIMAGAVVGTTGAEVADDQLMSIKLDATDKLSDQTSVEGWYAMYGPVNELGIKGTYTFVAGLEGSLELKSVTPGEDQDAVNSYKATIKATL